MKIDIKGVIISNDDAWIYDWFGMDYTTPSMVAKQLETAAGQTVEVNINSPGGYVDQGSEIYSELMAYQGKVIVNIVGMAASAASVAAMAGRPTRISPTGQLMIHNSSNVSVGDHRDHTKSAEMLKKTDQSISNAYRLKTGMGEDELLDLMGKETFFTAQEAVELKLADEIMFDPTNSLKFAANFGNSLLIPQAIVNKMRSEMKNFLKQDNQPEPAAAQTNTNEPETPGNKEEPTPMNMDELKNQHPELYAQVVEEGAKNEQTRINALNELAGAPGANEIIANAIKTGKTAAEAAVEIVKASAQRITTEGQKRLEDSQASGAHQVPADGAPLNDAANAATNEEQKVKDRASRMAAYANKLRGADK